MMEITNTRSNLMTDPSLHVWHGEIAFYLFLGGIVAGIMILTGAIRLWKKDEEPSLALRLLPWSSLILISIGMVMLAIDLENLFNNYRFYLALKPFAPMSWGAWILLLVYPVAAHYAWAETPEEWREKVLSYVPILRPWGEWSVRSKRFFGKLSIVAGSLLGIYTGVLLGAFPSRPFWNSSLLGPLFLVSGLSTGAAFMLLFNLRKEERVWFSLIDMLLIVSELGILALWMIGLAAGGEASYQALLLIFGGPYTAAFWTLVVALGLVVPLVGEFIERRHGSTPGRSTAILVLIGGFALRWIMVYAGQHSHWVSENLSLLQ
jgi:protein NrfD